MSKRQLKTELSYWEDEAFSFWRTGNQKRYAYKKIKELNNKIKKMMK